MQYKPVDTDGTAFERVQECKALYVNRLVNDIPMVMHVIQIPNNRDDKPDALWTVVHAGIIRDDCIDSIADIHFEGLSLHEAVDAATVRIEKMIKLDEEAEEEMLMSLLESNQDKKS